MTPTDRLRELAGEFMCKALRAEADAWRDGRMPEKSHQPASVIYRLEARYNRLARAVLAALDVTEECIARSDRPMDHCEYARLRMESAAFGGGSDEEV